jgi:hypothetical protein
MALGWNLADIISKVRATTSRPDPTMMTDDTIIDYINKVYQYVLPKELKIFWGTTYYQFYTLPNIDQYPAPVNFQTLNPGVTVDGFPVQWYLSPDNFWQDYPQQENKQVVGNGNPPLNNFNFTLSAYPVLARSVYVTDGSQIVQDVPTGTSGSGTFVDSVTGGAVPGAISYLTGTVTGLGFLVIPAANTNIKATYRTYLPNRPQGILFYKNQPLTDSTLAIRDSVEMFVVRPVPNQVYLIKMQGIQIPPPLVNGTDVPFRTDLGPLIAYMASLEIFADFNQPDQYQQTLIQYTRYKDVSMQDTYEEYLYERSVPAF